MADTGFVCHHPYGRRRTYRVRDAVCQVCYSCGSVRSTDEGWWPHGSFLYRSPDLLELDGRVRIREWWRWRQRAPLSAGA